MCSRPNSTSARPAPTEFSDIPGVVSFLAFTPFDYVMFSKDGTKRVRIPTVGFLKITEETDVEHPPMVIGDAEFTVGRRAPGSAPAQLQGTTKITTGPEDNPTVAVLDLVEVLKDNPDRDIIVVDKVAPYIPASHRGAVYTIPVRPRIYENEQGYVVGADGIDLYREAHD